MKRLIKRPLKALWRLTLPVRRPIVARFEAMIVRCCASAHQPHHCHVSEESGLLMDHLLRELVRLQTQVDHLQLTIEDMTTSGDPPGVVGRISAGELPELHSAAG